MLDQAGNRILYLGFVGASRADRGVLLLNKWCYKEAAPFLNMELNVAGSTGNMM